MGSVQLLFAAALLAATAGAGQAASEGAIEGRIVDARTQAPLAGANVLVVGTKLGATADAGGRFLIRGVPPGTYQLLFSRVGYQNAVRTDVVVAAGGLAQVEQRMAQAVILLPEVELTVRAPLFSDRAQAPVSSTGLTREEIRRFPGGFEDVVRTVTALPGVALVNEGGRNDLLVRGGGPAENLYLVNGLEVPNLNHFGTQGSTSGSLAYVNLDFIDRVEFSTGGFGARYGDRLSSVLDLDLRPGRDDRWGGKATVSATQFGLNLEGPAGPRGSLLASARRSYLDLIFKAAGQPFVPVYSDYNLFYEAEPTRNDRVSLLGLAAIDRVERERETAKDRRANAGIMGNRQDQFVGGARWRRLQEAGFFEVVAGANRTDFLFSQGDTAAAAREYFRSDATEGEAGVKVEAFRRLGRRTDGSAGIQLRRVSAETRTSFADTIYDRSGRAARRDSLGLPARLTEEVRSGKVGAWAQLERDLAARWRASLGLRADRFDRLRRPLALSPRGSLAWRTSERLRLQLAAGRYHQAPALVWLARPENRRLRWLRNDMGVLGAEWLLRDDTALTAEAYYKRYADLPGGIDPGSDSTAATDYLVLTNAGVGYGGREDDFQSFGLFPLASAGTGEAFGMEVLLQKRFSSVPCYGQLGVSVGKSGVRAANGRWSPSQFDQRFILSLSGGYVASPRWEFSGRLRVATGAPYTPVYDPARNPVRPGFIQNLPEEYLSERLDTTHQLDVRVDRRWNFQSWSMISFVDVQNIYNARPPSRPRWNFADGEVEDRGSIGILPSVGISAEF